MHWICNNSPDDDEETEDAENDRVESPCSMRSIKSIFTTAENEHAKYS